MSPPPTGAPADATGGEAAHDRHGAAGGALRRRPGTLQRPERLPVQTGASRAPHLPGQPPPGVPVGPGPRTHTLSSPSRQRDGWHPLRLGSDVAVPPTHCGHPWASKQLSPFQGCLGGRNPRAWGAGDPGWVQDMACGVCCLPPSTGSSLFSQPAGDPHLQMGKLRPGEGKRFADWLSHSLAMWPWEGSSLSIRDDHAPGWDGEDQGSRAALSSPHLHPVSWTPSPR